MIVGGVDYEDGKAALFPELRVNPGNPEIRGIAFWFLDPWSRKRNCFLTCTLSIHPVHLGTGNRKSTCNNTHCSASIFRCQTRARHLSPSHRLRNQTGKLDYAPFFPNPQFNPSYHKETLVWFDFGGIEYHPSFESKRGIVRAWCMQHLSGMKDDLGGLEPVAFIILSLLFGQAGKSLEQRSSSSSFDLWHNSSCLIHQSS